MGAALRGIVGNASDDSGWFCIPDHTEEDAIDIKADNAAAIRITNNHMAWDKNKRYPSHISYGIVTNYANNVLRLFAGLRHQDAFCFSPVCSSQDLPSSLPLAPHEATR